MNADQRGSDKTIRSACLDPRSSALIRGQFSSWRFPLAFLASWRSYSPSSLHRREPMNEPSRRELLISSTVVAAGAGLLRAEESKPAAAPAGNPDVYKLAERFGKFLRVTDVTDGLDALGRADKCLLD